MQNKPKPVRRVKDADITKSLRQKFQSADKCKSITSIYNYAAYP